MKVAHININYPIRSLHSKMVEALGNEGIDNIVFSPTYNRELCKVDINENIYLVECFKKNDRFFYHKKQQKIIKAFEPIVKQNNPDILHAHTLFSDGNVAMCIGERYEIPYICAVRNTDVNVFFKYMPWLKQLGIKIMLNSQKVVFLSEAYRKKVVNIIVPKSLRKEIWNKSIVLPNGIDDFWLKNSPDNIDNNIDRGYLKLLSVCEINKNKNILETVEAIKLLNKTKSVKCKLTIIGRAVDKRILKQLLLEGFIEYVEPKQKEQLIEYYRDADIFIMPSHTESFGLVYAEALSQGIPIIYTRGQGFDGHFKNGEVGYAVSDKNASEIVEAIEEIMENRKNLSSNAISLVRKFSWKSIANKYIDIYKEGIEHYEL